jgi:hypothetical protein
VKTDPIGSQEGGRSIWARNSTLELPDLIRSLFALSLLASKAGRPTYFCSPWISDFPLFSNAFQEFAPLFPDHADQRRIRFSDFLVQLSRLTEVRIVTTRSDTSRAFLSDPRFGQLENFAYRFTKDEFHEKGMLSPHFYLEGSMNITFMGVHIRQEKVILHTDRVARGERLITEAYLEFDRRWVSLDAAQ